MTGLLIFIGLILVILNVLSIRKQNKSFNGVLTNAIEDTHDYDIRIGELRREFSESILELQSELMHIKENMEESNGANINYEKSTSYMQDVNDIDSNDKIQVRNKNEIIIEYAHNKNSEKVEEIKRLFAEGFPVEEISEIMHLGKGEVLLIKDLYIR
ncbi:DUF6115 domain-containing protein [Clostridium sp. CF012]|uniref:DUF6115 domain-containing protein n=1 Tax=Clostridium sp. CF012 TaxID=2843319 RepID=UPI001C0B9DC5|nr:hypothetical protein [Clostridium sp. CF012]MBU3142289.1 hypothetical protein [Clostridium sp. CF012]